MENYSKWICGGAGAGLNIWAAWKLSAVFATTVATGVIPVIPVAIILGTAMVLGLSISTADRDSDENLVAIIPAIMLPILTCANPVLCMLTSGGFGFASGYSIGKHIVPGVVHAFSRLRNCVLTR